ncbi:hypothetical protein LI82_03740 [Methanococcoides methylutens]|uniref:BioF2-like acetyltransferase domain-containing protein n=1 Tax=Methanococcoides methylutens TaxID=2226 RepID=A0A099T4N8_METMT|nr:GNAT family N-acetyltransferase [Methanococcoides methylutens]KGK99151.1 hypothetical protein LI82_03740 [Methanococcoides methylutens]
MDFEIKQLKLKDEMRWDDFVMKNGSTTFYHQTGWKNAIQDTYNHKPYYLFAENEVGEIAGIFPLFYTNNLFFGKRFVSVAFAPYGGVCADNEIIEKRLIDEAIDLGNKLNVDYCEFRCLDENNTHENMSCSKNCSTFILDISKGHECIWNNMNRNVRNRIRKGLKSNLNYEMDSSLNSLSTFYDLYARSMKRLGTPPHDINLFRNIHKQFPDNVFISKADLGDIPVSSFYLITFKNTLITAWGASLSAYFKLAPNDFMYWNCVKYASENNFRCVDFGRSLNNSGNEVFKTRWGCDVIPLSCYCYPPSKMISPQDKYGKLSKFWTKLPLPLVNKIGPKVRGVVP